MTAVLERRLGELRRRVLVRSWAYRQRHHARGVWFDLRRVLADAKAAYVIQAEDVEALLSEGLEAEPAGLALEPPKIILRVSADRIARIPSARLVPVRLNRELLEARSLALTPF